MSKKGCQLSLRMKKNNRKLFLLFSLTFALGVICAYCIFLIHIHYQARPAIVAYIHSSFPHIDESDLRLSGLPMPTRDWDVGITYSFVYNDFGEELHLTYYYKNTRPIQCFK